MPEPIPFPNNRRGASILVVDDEKRIADTLVLILESKGYVARAAYDALSAIAVCRARRFDLILSDVVMPGMNGIEMAVTIHSEFPSCPILLFSGQAASGELLDQARSRGYQFDLIAKPIHPDQLLERVAEAITASTVRTN